MRGVSLLLAAEDNPLVKKFLDNVYPHLPDDLKGYYNQSFDLETDFKNTVVEVKRRMLFCGELTTQPFFDIDLTIKALDELISVGRKVLEWIDKNGIPINPELRPYLDNEYKYSDTKDFEAFRSRNPISDETKELQKKFNLPHEFDNLHDSIFLRAYCEYLKAEALKQPSEQPIEDYPSSFYHFIKKGLLIPSKDGLVSTCPSVRDLIFRMTETRHDLPKTKDIHTHVIQARICTEGSIKRFRSQANSQYDNRKK